MLRVIVAERRENGLPKVRRYLEQIAQVCAFQWKPILLKNGSAAPIDPGDTPLLVFLEAPKADRHYPPTETKALLDQLTQSSRHRPVQLFVVSTGDDFDAEEAQEFWWEYPFVVGYEVQGEETAGEARGSLRLDDLRAVIAEMIRLTAGAECAPPIAVGSLLRMPLGETDWSTEEPHRTIGVIGEEYRRHKFASFLTGGVRQSLLSLRRLSEAIAATYPALSFARDGELREHPFRGTTAAKAFEQVVSALYGGNAAPPPWLDELRSKFAPNMIMPHALLLGETGTGKTLLARWLHRQRFSELDPDDSRHEMVADSLFQNLNCGAIPDSLIDAELFGGIRGSWTGLERHTPGKIFCACGGTLFLDEIGEMPLKTQTVLLKYLDDGRYYPVGGHGRELFIPAVVIAATNQPLDQLVAAGRFRRDLYERFRFRIRLPSLRERREYLGELVDFVLQNPQINPVRHVDLERESVVRQINYISHEALTRLKEHPWPGNFRELEQVLWRGAFQAAHQGSETLLARHILFDDDLSS